jgi:hypothetical protein
MRRTLLNLTLASLLVCAGAAHAAEPDRAVWGQLADLAGKSFVGTPVANPTGAKDYDRWEWVLGGTTLRRTHATADGAYGGETLIYWDGKDQRLEYVYVTNSNFRTEGVFSIGADGSWTAEEEVFGASDVKKVRAHGKMSAGGYTSRSEYLKGDAWVPGHAFDYVQATTVSDPVINPKPARKP